MMHACPSSLFVFPVWELLYRISYMCANPIRQAEQGTGADGHRVAGSSPLLSSRRPCLPHEVKAGPDAALGAYFERDSVIVGNSSHSSFDCAFHEHGLTASESMRKRSSRNVSRR